MKIENNEWWKWDIYEEMVVFDDPLWFVIQIAIKCIGDNDESEDSLIMM